ncbi:MAG: hypothetical protein J6K21_00790 [Bacilli bacterium]|nr:hypothetical protein [Bacilli bacterium]
MYTETNNFSIRSVILQFLFVALFVFILIWLFPMKSDLKKAVSSIDNSKNNSDGLSVLTDRIFNENIYDMKDAAQSYFTNERLPQKVGATAKITLREMLDKKIILPFTDKNGKQCDLDSSYVEITKSNNEEYLMKVNLKCGEEENYLLVHLGCYNYCSGKLCEKKGTTAKIYKTETKKVTPSTPKTPKYRTLYEYKKTTAETVKYTPWSEWSTTEVKSTNNIEVETKSEVSSKSYYTDWSEWSTTKVEATATREVETDVVSKTEQYYTKWSDWSTTKVSRTETREVETKTETEKKYLGTKTETQLDYSKPIYEKTQVVIGSSTTKTCSLYNVTTTVTGYNETYVGMQKFSSKQTSSALIRYELVGTYNWYCDGECTAGKTFVYKVYQRTPISSSTVTCAKYDTVKTVILGNRYVLTGYETKTIKTPVYKNVKVTYYRYRDLKTKAANTTYYRYRDLILENQKVKYYRYRTKSVTPGTVSIKWSVYNDTKLLKAGYSYTGNTKTELIK